MTTRAKNEISHRVLDAKKNQARNSARYFKIGSLGKSEQGKRFQLVDKVIYPVNICQHCGSLATFHRRIQENRDIVGNVYQVDSREETNGKITMKFDYCLDCHKEFLSEMYIFKAVKEIKKNKKGFWSNFLDVHR